MFSISFEFSKNTVKNFRKYFWNENHNQNNDIISRVVGYLGEVKLMFANVYFVFESLIHIYVKIYIKSSPSLTHACIRSYNNSLVCYALTLWPLYRYKVVLLSIFKRLSDERCGHQRLFDSFSAQTLSRSATKNNIMRCAITVILKEEETDEKKQASLLRLVLSTWIHNVLASASAVSLKRGSGRRWR